MLRHPLMGEGHFEKLSAKKPLTHSSLLHRLSCPLPRGEGPGSELIDSGSISIAYAPRTQVSAGRLHIGNKMGHPKLRPTNLGAGGSNLSRRAV